MERLMSTCADPIPDAVGGVHHLGKLATAGVMSSPPLPVMVYYHGGGFALFSSAVGSFNGMCYMFYNGVGVVSVSVNYCLALDHWAYFGGDERTPSVRANTRWLVNLRRSDLLWKVFLPVDADRDRPATHVTDENVE
uniref:Alpha/beta hydrolase fold-3 domain-containing protein n=1 Tax=Oryza punctata TaxID=4537 RepID=A0A0E0LD31_ORYPU